MKYQPFSKNTQNIFEKNENSNLRMTVTSKQCNLCKIRKITSDCKFDLALKKKIF